MANKSCVGGSIEVMVGARTGADIVGAMLVAPEQLGIDMSGRASEGVTIGRAALAEGLSGVVGSRDHDALRRLIGQALGR
jgi:hypothetical protein